MEGSNPTPYFLNIIFALRRLFIIFLLYFKCFYYSNFFVCSGFFCRILSIFVSSFFIFHISLSDYTTCTFTIQKNSAQAINLPLITQCTSSADSVSDCCRVCVLVTRGHLDNDLLHLRFH